MAHYRPRHATQLFRKNLQFSPIVGVFGHRQVGKTSFVSQEADHPYLSLDDEDYLAAANASGKQFLVDHAQKGLVIDECQYAPPLFPALKEWVRKHPKPGQFILTGSVRFSSRSVIRESLTGRLLGLELFPLVLSEILEHPLPETVLNLMKLDRFDQNAILQLSQPNAVEQAAFEKYLELGGLPKLAFTRDSRTRLDYLDYLLRLILDRDLRLVVDTQLSLETLLRFLRYLATHSWEPFRYADSQRAVGISEITQKKILRGLEAIYLVRRLSNQSGRSHTYLLEDQLEERVLSGGKLSRERQILGALYRNLRAQLGYQPGKVFEAFSVQHRSGATLPLVFQCEGRELGFVVVQGENLTLGQTRSIDRFLRDFPSGKVIAVVGEAIRPRLLDSRVMQCSAASVMI